MQPTTSTPTLSFGAPAPSTAPPAFGSSFSSTLQTSAPSGGALFGAKPAATTSTAFGVTTSTAFGATPGTAFGAPTGTAFGATTAPPTGLSFGVTTAAATTAFSLGGTAPTTTAAIAKIGLGGIDVNAAQPKTTEGKTDSSKVKELQLPQEIIATVDTLKAHFKQQKTLSSDIVRASTTKLYNISNELNKLNWSLTEIHNNVDANYVAIKQLRAETTKAIQEAEIAQRTHDTLSGLQFENTAPLFYFVDMVRKFETDMQNLSKQVELTEKHMNSLTNPQTFTADDLKKGLQQIHECFIALAGRLQETHRMVEMQNDQFCNLMKHREKGTTIVNVYDGAGSDIDNLQLTQRFHSASRAIIPNASCGPTPFSSFVGANQLGQHLKPSANHAGNPGGGAFGGSAWGDSSMPLGASGLGFGNSGGSLFGTGVGTTEEYNLQKPPLGTKRNKH